MVILEIFLQALKLWEITASFIFLYWKRQEVFVTAITLIWKRPLASRAQCREVLRHRA